MRPAKGRTADVGAGATGKGGHLVKRIGGIVNQIEETLIAVLLGLMTLITFANVIARYVFNDNILWALEATVFLFAWLGLLLDALLLIVPQ